MVKRDVNDNADLGDSYPSNDVVGAVLLVVGLDGLVHLRQISRVRGGEGKTRVS